EADGIAGAIVFDDSVFLQNGEESVGDILARISRAGGLEPCVHAFEHRFLRIEEFLRWFTQKDGARKGAVIALVAAGDFEKSALAGLQRRIVPGEMRRGGIGARWQQRNDCRVISTKAVHTADAGIVDLGDKVALA